MTTIICSKCRIKKSRDQFHADKTRPSGICNECKSCKYLSVRDHEHVCMKCEYQNCKNSNECYDRLSALIEQQYQIKVTQPKSEFSVFCNDLKIPELVTLKTHVYDKLVEYLISRRLIGEGGEVDEPKDLQIWIEPKHDFCRYKQELIVHVPLELKFSELHVDKFHEFLFFDIHGTHHNSMQIPYIEECDSMIISYSVEYLMLRFPYLRRSQIKYSHHDEYILVAWPENFTMSSREIEAAVAHINNKIVDLLFEL